MWGGNFWSKAYFSGLYWGPLGGIIPPVVVEGRRGSDDPGKKRRKNKFDVQSERPYQSPANFPREPIPAIKEAPESVTIDTAPAGKPIAVVVPKAVKRALAPKAPRSILQDPAVQRRLAEVQARLRMEREDEEILLLLGGFD